MGQLGGGVKESDLMWPQFTHTALTWGLDGRDEGEAGGKQRAAGRLRRPAQVSADRPGQAREQVDGGDGRTFSRTVMSVEQWAFSFHVQDAVSLRVDPGSCDSLLSLHYQ